MRRGPAETTTRVLHGLLGWTPPCPRFLPPPLGLSPQEQLGARPRAHFSPSLPPRVSSSAPGALDAGRIRQTDRPAPPAVTSPLSPRPARPVPAPPPGRLYGHAERRALPPACFIPTPVCQWRRGLTSCAGRHLGALRNPLGSSSPAPTSPRSTLSSRFSAPQTNLALSFPLCVHGPGYGRGSLTGAPESTPASLVAIPPSAGGTLMQTRAWGPRLSGPLSSWFRGPAWPSCLPSLEPGRGLLAHSAPASPAFPTSGLAAGHSLVPGRLPPAPPSRLGAMPPGLPRRPALECLRRSALAPSSPASQPTASDVLFAP